VLEALAARCVAVYADIPGVRELTGEAGVFVSDPQPSTLELAIERATFDGTLRNRVSHDAWERSKHFTWDRTAELTAEALGLAFDRRLAS
jgi:glycosyltransferase involved in cell wall biosynthesis